MIYLDNAATTQVSEEVLEAMLPYYREFYGNPGSLHDYGLKAAKAVEQARETIAATINARPENIIFTSGGSEANSLAILGIADYLKKIGKMHIITTCVEHKSVLNSIKQLIYHGFDCTFLPVSDLGYISLKDFESSIRQDTGLVSIMYMNNETGNLYDIEQIGSICKKHEILFHSDCVQAYGCIPIDVTKCDVDLLSVSGHKIHAPKGTGFLFAKNTKLLKPMIFGGSQEYGIRAGTENVPAIVGLAKAASIFTEEDFLYHSQYRYKQLKEILLKDLNDGVKNFKQNGMPCPESKIINIRFDGVDGETLVLMLNSMGACVSSGAACNSRKQVPSHVLTAIGLTDEQARSSIRISFSSFTSMDDVREAASKIQNAVKALTLET